MRIKNNKIDIIIEMLCILLLVGISGYILFMWSSIPEKIPMHYDALGNIDRWGDKAEIIILPITSWLMYLFMTGIGFVPTLWNTGVKVTQENQERVYRTLKYLMKTMKLIVVLDFSILTLYSLLGKSLPSWFTIVILIAVFGNLLFWIVRLFKVK